jgi:hypothetical protein
MAERTDANFLEIVAGQSAQQFAIDVVLMECLLATLEAEASQPGCDIHPPLPSNERCSRWNLHTGTAR